jgi:GR25 family glycosyltransferase involved in LPS biosynthesis
MEDAYVINLASSTDRWEKIQKDFKGSNINLHRVEPVHLQRRKYAKLTQREFGARSLALTFLKLIEMAKNKNLPEVLILEDDCFPVKNFKTLWPKIKSWLREHPDLWDMYSGGSIFIRDPFIIGYTKDLTFYSPKKTRCSQWIWVQRDSYDRIIKVYKEALYSKYPAHTDVINDRFNKVISYPFISYQSNKQSTLNKRQRSTPDIFIKEERSLKNYRTRKLYHKAVYGSSKKTTTRKKGKST